MTVRYAGFWMRFIAHCIDSFILTVTSWLAEMMILGAVYWIRMIISRQSGGEIPVFTDAFNPTLLQIMNIPIYLALAIPYYVIGHYRYATTLGKRPLHIYVVQHSETHERITLKQSFIRCFGYFVSYLPFCTGYVMAGIHSQKRALHDLMAGTVSVIGPLNRRTSP